MRNRGYSLVEVMIAMVAVGAITVALVALAQRGGRNMVAAQDQFQAAQLLDFIQGRLQLAQFEDVFAVDSANKNGVSAGAFQPHQYWVRWASSPIQTALLDMESRIRAAGFSRYVVEVQFIRRDSADNAANSSVVDFISFQPLAACTVAAGCVDKFNPEIKFQVRVPNAPTEYYYDVDGSGRTEVPDTKIKLLNIYLYKGGTQVLAREGVVLAKEKVAGRADEKYSSDLKLLMTFPVDTSRYFRDREDVYHGFVQGIDYQAGSTVGAGILSGKFFRQKGYAKGSSWSWSLQAGDKTNAGLLPRVAGYSERDAIVSLWIGTATFPPVGAPSYEWRVTADNGAFNNPWGGAFADEVYGEGLHGFVFRARKGPVGSENYSPWKICYVNTDITAPNARSTELTPLGGATVNTRSPYVELFLRDEDSGFLIPPPTAPVNHLAGVSGLAAESLSIATMAAAVPASAADIGYNRFVYTAQGIASGTLVMIDTTTLLPYVLPDGQDAHLRAEFGDKTGYKAVKTWSFQVADMDFSDATSPVFVPPATIDSGSPLVMNLSDPESGIDWGSFELFHADTGVVLLSSATTPGLGACLNPGTNAVSFSTSAFTRGAHNLRLTVSNWSRGDGITPTNRTTVTNFLLVVQ